MPRLRLSRSARLISSAGFVVLHSDVATLELPGGAIGALVDRLAPLLDGTRDRGAIAGALPEPLRPPGLALLDLLERQGLVEIDAPAPAAAPTDRLRRASVLIVGAEPWAAAAAAALKASGVGAVHAMAEGELTLAELGARPYNLLICAESPGDPARHLQWARLAHQAGLASLYAALERRRAFLGPAVIPGQTACWCCARLRQIACDSSPRAARAVHDALLADPIPTRPRAHLAAVAPLVGHLVALEAHKLLIAPAESALVGAIALHDLVTPQSTLHRVIPLARCEICGGAGALPEPDPAAATALQATSPGELRAALAGWVDPITGVIPYLEERAAARGAPRVPTCWKALVAGDASDRRAPLRLEPVGGKGLSAVDAMIGAVGEALERYSAARVPVAALRRDPIAALEGDVIDPRRLCLYDEAQYGRPGFPFARFAPDRPYHWARARWLDTGEPVWVPAQAAYYGLPCDPEEELSQVTSNGLAAGGDLEDAALRATLELVERDAFLLTWLCRLPARRLLPAGLDAGAAELVRALEDQGARVELYLLDAGLGVPAVACLALGDGRRWPGVTVSTAAHSSPALAARGALLEQGYSGASLAKIVQAREHPIPEHPAQVRSFLEHALYYAPPERAAAFDFLRAGAPIALADVPERPPLTAASCAAHLAARGVRIAVLDVTAPDVRRSPYRVVRALAPGLQPLHCGFGLERLASPRLRDRLVSGLNPHVHPIS